MRVTLGKAISTVETDLSKSQCQRCASCVVQQSSTVGFGVAPDSPFPNAASILGARL